MGQPKRKPKPKRIVTLQVAPEKLQAIFPRAERLSVFNPHAATPPSPIVRSSRHVPFADSLGSTVALSSTSLFRLPRADASHQQTTLTLSASPTVEPQLPLQPSDWSPSNTVMAEKDSQKQPAAGSAAAAPANGEGGVPFYESQRKHLQKLLEKKRKLTESLVNESSPTT